MGRFLPLSKRLILDGEFYELIESEEFEVNPKFHVVLLSDNDLGMLKRWLKSQLGEELEFKVRLAFRRRSGQAALRKEI